MKLIIVLLMSLSIVSCSHHHKETVHHHHAYDKHCALSVAHGKLDVLGKKEFSHKHSGETYYFSSLEKKEKFLKNIENNVSKADRNWSFRRER